MEPLSLIEILRKANLPPRGRKLTRKQRLYANLKSDCIPVQA